MKGTRGSVRAVLRRLATAGAALLLSACMSGGGSSPPGVEVPEPGARGRATGSAQPAPGAPGTMPPAGDARSWPAPSATLPIPSPGPSASTAGGTPGARSYPVPQQGNTPGSAATGAAGGREEPLAIEMEQAPRGSTPGTAASAADSRLVDGAHAPARSANNAVNALLAQADGARRSGNLEGAIAAAERALRIAPSDPAVYYELAVLRLRRGDRAAAEQLARKGLSHQPDAELRQRLEDLLAGLRSG